MSIHAPSEVEATLQRLSQHRGVRGVMILSNDTGRVLQHTGAMLETPASPAEEDTASESVRRSGSENQEDEKDAAGPANGHNVPLVNATVRKYADAVRRIVAATKDAVEGLDEKDALRFLRMRTGRYEMMITPEKKYTLVVFHDPSSN